MSVRLRPRLLKMVPWSSGDDSWPTSRQRWFESIRDHWAAGPTGGRRPRTPEMRVRIPRGPLAGGRKAGIRQPWKLETVGSIPTPLTEWAHGPTGRHQFGRLEIRVRFPVGPLEEGAGTRLEAASTSCPGGEMDDHASLRTRCCGFDSCSGYFRKDEGGRMKDE